MVMILESHSLNCNFENGDTCLWRNDKTDQSEWTLQTQGTDTSGTGPDNDHTLGTVNGKHIISSLLPGLFAMR